MVLNHLQASFSGKDGCLRGRAATRAGDGCAPQKACNPCAGVRVQHGMSTIPGGVRFGRGKAKGRAPAKNNPKITGKTFGPGAFLSGISKAFGPVVFQAGSSKLGPVRFGRGKAKGNAPARNNPKITGKTFGPGGFLSGISKPFGPVAFQATVKAEVQTGTISKLVAFKAAPSKFGAVRFYTASERLTVAHPQRDIRPVAAFGEVC